MTTNRQLIVLANKLGIKDFNVLVSPDEFKPLRNNQFRIVNIVTTQPIGHWCLASRIDDEYIYFDSFGCVPPDSVLEKCFNGNDYIGCDDEVQNGHSSECGVFALFVAYKLSLGEKYVDVLYELPYGNINH